MAILNIVKRRRRYTAQGVPSRDRDNTEDNKTSRRHEGNSRRRERGAGLAAPQVGILRRICVVDTGEEVLELINPKIIYENGEQEAVEGCLSIPDVWGYTHRPAKVIVKAMNRKGEEFAPEGEGVVARCFCHEIDHLDGKLFTDKAVHILTPDEVDEMMGDR